MFDVNKTVRLIKGALLEPQPTWQAYLPDSDDWKETAKDLTLPLIVGTLVLSLVLSSMFIGFYIFAPSFGLGGLLFGIVIGFVGFMITAFVLAWLAGAFKGTNDFDKAFAAVSLTAVPSYAGAVLGTLPWIGWLLSFGLMIYSLVLLYRIIPDYLDVPQGSRAGHFICSLIALLAVMLVIAGVFGVGMMGTIGGGV
ncbi:MAG: Yip1 family protein [Geminicoccaceae bacterium]